MVGRYAAQTAHDYGHYRVWGEALVYYVYEQRRGHFVASRSTPLQEKLRSIYQWRRIIKMILKSPIDFCCAGMLILFELIKKKGKTEQKNFLSRGAICLKHGLNIY